MEIHSEYKIVPAHSKPTIFLDIDGTVLDIFWRFYQEDARVTNKVNSLIKEKFPEAPAVDGYYHYTFKDITAAEKLNPSAVDYLHQLIKKIGKVSIVMSSSWRHGRSIDELKELFKKYEFSQHIEHKTDCYDNPDWSESWGRTEEIRRWLAEHPEVTNFVVLDDHPDEGRMLEEFKHRFIQVDPRTCLSKENIDVAEEILTPKRIKIIRPAPSFRLDSPLSPTPRSPPDLAKQINTAMSIASLTKRSQKTKKSIHVTSTPGKAKKKTNTSRCKKFCSACTIL